jgi:putative ABC transport system substrate-binding protein
VDLLVAVTALGASAIKETSTSIPVVFVLVGDPVGLGLADSLSSPGKNFTGLSIMQQDLSGKRLALLREAVPQASLIALFVDPAA